VITMTIYKYIRPDGGVTVSPVKPACDYTEMVRIMADNGKMLTQDGEALTSCTDTDSADGWYEVDEPKEMMVSHLNSHKNMTEDDG
jgi:hypothetical protein